MNVFPPHGWFRAPAWDNLAMTAAPPPTTAESPARLAATLGHSISAVVAASRRLGITPTLILDGREYFSGDGAERIAAELRGDVTVSGR